MQCLSRLRIFANFLVVNCSYAKFVRLKELAKDTMWFIKSRLMNLLSTPFLRLYNQIEEEISTIEAKIEGHHACSWSAHRFNPWHWTDVRCNHCCWSTVMSPVFRMTLRCLLMPGLDAGRYQSGQADHKGTWLSTGPVSFVKHWWMSLFLP